MGIFKNSGLRTSKRNNPRFYKYKNIASRIDKKEARVLRVKESTVEAKAFIKRYAFDMTIDWYSGIKASEVFVQGREISIENVLEQARSSPPGWEGVCEIPLSSVRVGDVLGGGVVEVGVVEGTASGG